MTNPWNDRYAKEEYIYGKSPNKFYEECLSTLSPGKILFLGEGEGRNAVHAAKLGWLVDAVDGSSFARDKALKLASEYSVSINYSVEDLADFDPDENKYDVVALIFLHLPEELRQQVHATAYKALRPGAKLILEAFEKEQINFTSGGPKNIDLLYSLEEIFTDFQEMTLIKFEKASPILDEGPLHQGPAKTIRFFAEK